MRRGEEVKRFLRIEKEVSQSLDQTNFLHFLVNACKGLAIAAKFLTNLL